MIKDNNKISTEVMASALGISSKTIKRRIKAMTNIRFVGSGYRGHWEIEEQPSLTSTINAGVFVCIAIA